MKFSSFILTLVFVCVLALTLPGQIFAQDSTGFDLVFVDCPDELTVDVDDSVYYRIVAMPVTTEKACPPIHYYLVSGPGQIDSLTGWWIFHPRFEEPILQPSYEVEVAAFFTGDTVLAEDRCRFAVHVVADTLPLYTVRIGTRDLHPQGDIAKIPVVLETLDPKYGLGGFDLLISHDPEILTLAEVVAGDLYAECDWEYFTYQPHPYEDCTECPPGLTQVIGIAETNNGTGVHPNPDCQTTNPGYVGDLPVALFNLMYSVSSDPGALGEFSLLRFFWVGCTDNTLSGFTGDELYVSRDVYEVSGWEPISDTAGVEFPTFLGAQEECFVKIKDSLTPSVRRRVDFYNGGVGITSERPPAEYAVKIGVDLGPGGSGVPPDQNARLAVTLERADWTFGLGGFDLLMAYDYPALRFLEADEGNMLLECGWEYFTYAFPMQDTGTFTGDYGLIRVVALAETNNGAGVHPNPDCQVDTPGWFYQIPDTLCHLNFSTILDSTSERVFHPVRFYWQECKDNLLTSGYMSYAGPYLYGSAKVYDYGSDEPINETIGIEYPTFLGAQEQCIDLPVIGDAISPVRNVDFYNGGVKLLPGPVDDEIVVRIQNKDRSVRGRVTSLNIFLEKSPNEFGGFHLLLNYDPTQLMVTDVNEGTFLDECGWEYFTYRFGPEGNCGSACPEGYLQIIAIAEISSTPGSPSCHLPDVFPASLASVDFLVTTLLPNDMVFIPVRFFWWNDCMNNSFTNPTGTAHMVARNVFDHNSMPIMKTDTLPSYAPDCIDPIIDFRMVNIDFYNGGIGIVPPDTPHCDPGDLNGNGATFEITDLIVFIEYFLEGWSAFGEIDSVCVMEAGDANQDGVSLSVADLIYVFRIVIENLPTYEKSTAQAGTVTLFHDEVANEVYATTDDTLGVIWLMFEGDIVPQPATGFLVNYHYDGTYTRMLVSAEVSLDLPSGGLLISYTGTGVLVNADAGSYDGKIITVVFGAPTDVDPLQTDGIPSVFALQNNYPNPFNPSTNIQYEVPHHAHVEIAIFNVNGQRVRTLVNATKAAGVYTVTWDGTSESGDRVSSGMYFYRMTAGDYVQSRKMILLK